MVPPRVPKSAGKEILRGLLVIRDVTFGKDVWRQLSGIRDPLVVGPNFPPQIHPALSWKLTVDHPSPQIVLKAGQAGHTMQHCQHSITIETKVSI